MKKFLLFLFILEFYSFCNAQNIFLGKYIENNSYSRVKNFYYSHERGPTWQWDTIITYDTLGSKMRYTHTFDSNGKEALQKAEQWQTNKWVDYNQYKFNYTYDNKGILMNVLFQLWYKANWVDILRLSYTYDTIGNILCSLFERQMGTWTNDRRFAYTYDSINNKLTETIEIWQANSWNYSTKSIFRYNQNGHIVSNLYKIWCVDDWCSFWSDTLIYNSKAQVIKCEKKGWKNNSWVDSSRNTYTYDPNGNQLINILEISKDTLWINYVKKTYSYDQNGNSLTGIYEIWENVKWIRGQYMLNLFLNDQEVPFSFTGTFHRYEAKYSQKNTSIDKLPSENGCIKVYPNPACDKINVQITQSISHKAFNVSIYNMQGKVVIQQPVSDGNTEIDISSFPGGVYMMRFTNQETSILKKLIKE